MGLLARELSVAEGRIELQGDNLVGKPEAEMHFAADPLGAGVRLILSGSPADVMLLMNRFFEEQGTPSA